MKAMRMIKYSNGSKFKHLPNRSVALISGELKSDDIIIEFSRADIEKNQMNLPSSKEYQKRGKVKVTAIPISRAAALALYACLNDYFIRVDTPNATPTSAPCMP